MQTCSRSVIAQCTLLRGTENSVCTLAVFV
jgi:hypothetical protein